MTTPTCVLLITVLLAASEVRAQRATTSVVGAVTDPSGASVPGASITVRNLGTGVERTVLTNEAGYYTVTALPAGRSMFILTALPNQSSRLQK